MRFQNRAKVQIFIYLCVTIKINEDGKMQINGNPLQTDGLILSAITIGIPSCNKSASGGHGCHLRFFVDIETDGLHMATQRSTVYSSKFETIEYKSSFAYGVWVSIFSAIVCSCWQYFSMVVLFPESINNTIEQVVSALSAQYTDEQMDAILPILNNLPQINLFVNLIYFTLFGLVTSAIIANFTKKVNPFNDINTAE